MNIKEFEKKYPKIYKLTLLFEKETGKNAIISGKPSEQFKQWLNQRKIIRVKPLEQDISDLIATKEGRISDDDYAIQLEIKFDKYRVFGDNRDLTKFNIRHSHPTQSNILCVIHRISPRVRPDLIVAMDNLMTCCEYCVLGYIGLFKEYRIQNKMPESNFK